MGFDLKKISINSIRKKFQGNLDRYDDKIRAKASRSGLGDFIGVSTSTTWRLKMIDPPHTAFEGQHIAENLTEAVSARISDQGSLNKQDTEKVWLGGDPGTLTFTTRIWATSNVKSVRASINKLRTFTKRDPKLKRAPMFVFTAGTDLSFNVFVKSIGGISYDRPRQDGTIRGATFNVTLLVIDEVVTETQSMSLGSLVKTGLGLILPNSVSNAVSSFLDIPGGSLHTKGKMVIVKDGQTFEHIAQLEYGDASVGDILRRAYYNSPLNLIKNSLEVGDYLDLVDDNEIYSIPVEPQSIALKTDTVNLENIRTHFESKNIERTIYPSG